MTYYPHPGHDLSTTEHRTGEWVEGKPIYRKLLKQSGNMTHSATTDVAHGLTGVTKFLRAHGTCLRSNGSSMALPWHDIATGSNAHVRFSIDATNLKIELGSFWTGAGNVLSNAWVIIEYIY